MQNDLFFRKLTDYWDSNTGIVARLSSQIALLSPEERTRTLETLRNNVEEHLRVLPQRFLPGALFVVADDLYKTGNSISFWSQSVEDYLRATACVLFCNGGHRGYVIHDLINNTFAEMQRPFDLFPNWFGACEILYECPQLLQRDAGCDLETAIRSCSHRFETRDTSVRPYSSMTVPQNFLMNQLGIETTTVEAACANWPS